MILNPQKSPRIIPLRYINTLFLFTFFFAAQLAAEDSATDYDFQKSQSKDTPGSKEESPEAVSDNPGAVSNLIGIGTLGTKLGLKEDSGIRLGALFVEDYSRVFSGGLNPRTGGGNALEIIGLSFDTEKLHWWKGGHFNISGLQYNGRPLNDQAGIIQEYDNLPVTKPFDRTELYEIWYRQDLFDKKLVFHIGKMATTAYFTRVLRPVAYTEKSLSLPAISGLTYAPLFVYPSMLYIIPGYYNSAYGVTATFAPTKSFYVSYGAFDGNKARNKETGLRGPQFNGYYFHIAETGITWMVGKGKYKLPGSFAIGGWYQSGKLTFPQLSGALGVERGVAGVYWFGTQWLWRRHPGVDNSGIVSFIQGGTNNSKKTQPFTLFSGGGLTFFGLIPGRIQDSFGWGYAWSKFNRRTFPRPTEFMTQAYYQMHLVEEAYLIGSFTYVPNPGAKKHLKPASAGTIQLLVLL